MNKIVSMSFICILCLLLLEGCVDPISTSEEINREIIEKINQLPDNSNILEKIKEKEIEKRIEKNPIIEFGDIIEEREGIIYIIGNPSPQERQNNLINYKQRMDKREQIVNAEIERAHEIQIEKIKAQTMLDYLLAESLAYGNKTKPQNNKFYIRGSKATASTTGGNIGNITTTSTGGDSTANGGSATASSTGTTNNNNTNSNINDNDNINDNANNNDNANDNDNNITIK